MSNKKAIECIRRKAAGAFAYASSFDGKDGQFEEWQKVKYLLWGLADLCISLGLQTAYEEAEGLADEASRRSIARVAA